MTDHTEAPLSFSTKMYNPQGLDCIVTMRPGATGEMWVELQKNFDALTAHLVEHGWTPNTGGRGGASHPVNVEQPPATPPRQPVQASGDEPNVLTFPAEKLIGSTHGDKVYWKVQGGPFSRFGVTIWPEALAAAGFDVNVLVPTDTYDLTGFTAHYITTDEGKPQKVTALTK